MKPFRMMDFSLRANKLLIDALKDNNYIFQTFEEFMSDPADRAVVLRHDIDKRPGNALKIALMESSSGIKASYHFRITESRKKPEYLIKIAKLGHEIAYHYEDLSRLSGRNKPDKEIFLAARDSFREKLQFLRKYYPVRVISMHGDPKSRTDNRDLWKFFDYRQEGIICEPYLDIDYSSVLYITDTGRRWNGDKSNLRDKIFQGTGITTGEPVSNNFTFRHTWDIVNSVQSGLLPPKIIINTHPQRWSDNTFQWSVELIMQNIKNILKYLIGLYRR